MEKTYGWLRQAAEHVRGFAITDRIVIGNFAYAKLPMVKDLENSIDELIASDLIASIAGDEEAREKIRDASDSIPEVGPDQIPLADEFLVLDADSSQNAVINAAVGKASLVVKGPPGTGKSQTIANLITTLVARGETVLFVAEKRAAIDAVLKRLQKERLDDLILDLHGGIASKRTLAQDIAKALHNTGHTPPVDRHIEQRRIETQRERLNQFAAALHQKRSPWDVTVYEAQSELLGLASASATGIRLRGEELENLDAVAFESVRDALERYAGLGGFTLQASENPWAGVTVSSESDARTILETLSRIRAQTMPNSLRLLRSAAAETGTDYPEGMDDWRRLVTLWSEVKSTLDEFSSAIYDVDLERACAVLAPAGKGIFAELRAYLSSAEFRKLKKEIGSLTNPGVKGSASCLLRGCQAAHTQLRAWRLYGGRPSAPERLEELVAICNQLHEELSEMAPRINRSELPQLTTSALEDLIEQLLQEQTTLTRLPELYRLEQLLIGAGLGDLLQELGRRQVSRDQSTASLRYAWLSSILEQIALADPIIGAFDADEQSTVVEQFRHGDREHVETTAARVRRLCAERATSARDDHKEAAALLQQQASRKRGHLPVRQLFEATSDVLLALKPCWVMSPLVVSQLLPGRKYFDVVVFDEASQVQPADAVPAILRGER